MSLVDILKDKLQESSQHFQVAFQTLELRPKTVKRIFETGYAMYKGGKEAKNPLFLHIEPTGACNLKCTMCPRTESITREMRHMKLEMFQKICDAVNPICLAFVGFGEPLVNPQTLDMVRYSVAKKIITRISSNATLLGSKRARDIVQTGLHQIWFSVDSPSAGNFEAIRVGAKFDEVIFNLKEFMKIREEEKSKIAVTVNFTITHDNVHETPRMVDFCREELQITPTFARGYGYDIAAQQGRSIKNTDDVKGYIREALKKAEDHKMKQVARNLRTILFDIEHPLDGKGPCYFPYYVVAVSWDGKVSPCCLFYDYQMNLGSFQDKSFDEIWNGKAYQNFRMKLKTNRPDIKICNTCNLNDISLHNMMSRISRFPGAGLLTQEKYEYIQRE